jgi:transposase
MSAEKIARMARPKRTDHTTKANARGAPGNDYRSPAFTGGSALSQAEILARAASARTPVEHRRWQVIGLLADGAALDQILAATGYRPRTVRQIAQRYRECGPAGLVDGRQWSKGATPILSEGQQRELRQALQSAAPDGGVWTGPKVARWIAARTEKRVRRQRGWEYLQRLGAPAVPVSGGQQATHVRDDDTNRFA